jgi:hypothetical protein
MAQRFLGAGLAGRAGDGDDLCLDAVARRDAKFFERRQHIADDDHGNVETPERRQFRFGNDEQHRSSGHGGVAKSWPSIVSPLMAKKASPGTRRAAVDGNTRDAFRHDADWPAIHRGDHRFGRPEQAHPASSLSALRTSSWSENG